MRAVFLLSLLSATTALAKPFQSEQVALGSHAVSGLSGEVLSGKSQSSKVVYDDRWPEEGTKYVEQDEIVYELVSHPSFAEHQLRITKPKLCDSSVKQYSGYLDIADDKHLFFWFFESRTSPKSDPLVMWLNGGPGCSSTSGLLFELGPCSIDSDGKGTTPNPYSWNNNANLIFLDQPVNVGYSYASSNSTDPINTTPLAAKDVYAFLELFITRFTKYAELPFHIAAESYGGAYAPNIASVIYHKNKQLEVSSDTQLKKINLQSILIGNGLTDPKIQMPSVVNYACNGPFSSMDPNGKDCVLLRLKAPVCERLIDACYRFPSRASCVPANFYCWTQIFGPIVENGKNIYDARKPCDRAEDKDGPLCYKELAAVEKYMNLPEVKAALGANPNKEYATCNMKVNERFQLQGDGMHNSAKLLPELVEDGIRLLIYAGNADMVCNTWGEEKWLLNLESTWLEEFIAAPTEPWFLDSGEYVGTVRSAGGFGFTAGNVTYIDVFEAGHMVPHDQPEAALDMFNKWIFDVPLSSGY